MPNFLLIFSRIVLSSPEMLKHPFSITLFGDWMYWSDWDRNAIFQADKFNGQRASLVANSSMVCSKLIVNYENLGLNFFLLLATQIPMVIHVYHPYRQPEAQNHCLPLNGRCSHVCLPAPQLTANSAKTSCACPRGLRLDNDNLNCIHDRKLFCSSPKFVSTFCFIFYFIFVSFLMFSFIQGCESFQLSQSASDQF